MTALKIITILQFIFSIIFFTAAYISRNIVYVACGACFLFLGMTHSKKFK